MRTLPFVCLLVVLTACGGGAATAQPLAAGQTARVGDLALTYTGAKVRTFAPSEIMRPPAGQQWIDVDLIVRNRGTSAATIYVPQMFTLIDAQGRRYPAPAITINPNPGIDGPLPAGETIRGTVVFGTPVGSGPYRLRYTRPGTAQTATWAVSPQ